MVGKIDAEIWKLEQPDDAIIFENTKKGIEEYEKVMGIIRAISHHSKARDIFSGAFFERTGFYTDKKTGIWSRFRVDAVNRIENFGVILMDYKTSVNIDYGGFQRSISKYGYDIQMAHYMEGVKEITGSYPDKNLWIVSENVFPNETSIFEAHDSVIEIGFKKRDKWMQRLGECLDSQKWPQANENILMMHPTLNDISKAESGDL